jgi:hypothetical protein
MLRLANPLPQFVGSLSKYIRAEKYYELLSSIQHDIPESDLRAKFDPNLYATAKARYLLIENGIVRRDKLVDLIHDEGTFSERVKMVMYFLFMFRDPRYREFICNVVGQKNGKWDTRVFSDTRAEFFEHAGGRKAFTNLRQFLSQTGILDESSWAVRMPDPAQWFPARVGVVAYCQYAVRIK